VLGINHPELGDSYDTPVLNRIPNAENEAKQK